jgi:hypothetical protein
MPDNMYDAWMKSMSEQKEKYTEKEVNTIFNSQNQK